jgi:DNA-binding transcriptional LysR family regulator
MIDFRLLRHFWYFVAVAEERHFGKAAKRLGMSQPPLSQQIQILERLLGVTLFERSRQGARLTKEGLELLAPVQQFMEHARRLQLAVIDARQGRSAGIRIGAINSALFDIVPRLTRMVSARYPGMSLVLSEMDSAAALAAVQNGDVDIALARFDQPIGSVKVRPILNDHLVVVLPSDHPLTRRDRIALAELADQNLVLFPRRVSPSYFDQITSACREVGFSPSVPYEVSSVVSQIAFVGCRLAIGLVPSRSMRFGGADVVFRPLTQAINVVTIAAAWDETRCNDRILELIDIAAEMGAEMQRVGAPPRV